MYGYRNGPTKEKLMRPSIKDDRNAFLRALRGATGAIGNMALRAKLGWAESRYWRVHQSLIEDGRIQKGRGRGGSVLRA